ncbi:MAG TPA: hypothetical protein VM345_13085 [Acidimicrobiales bacterium]|jgi:hypothetical protein|nr:hypothetical protein [Acidimicrobiales bacterium]
MAQPDYVPVNPGDRVRESEALPPPKRWTATRPGELRGLRPPEGDAFGHPGPDQGYALKLARQLKDRLELDAGEHAEDAIAGCLGVALKRASIFGRAPVIYDLELAFTLFGFLGEAPRELVTWRRELFDAASHHYWDQREIVDLVPEETLRLTPAEVASRVPADWRSLIDASDG